MKKFYVNYKYVSRKTGNVANSGGIYVEANDRNEAEAKALVELKRNPRVQGTEGFDVIIVKVSY